MEKDRQTNSGEGNTVVSPMTAKKTIGRGLKAVPEFTDEDIKE